MQKCCLLFYEIRFYVFFPSFSVLVSLFIQSIERSRPLIHFKIMLICKIRTIVYNKIAKLVHRRINCILYRKQNTHRRFVLFFQLLFAFFPLQLLQLCTHHHHNHHRSFNWLQLRFSPSLHSFFCSAHFECSVWL